MTSRKEEEARKKFEGFYPASEFDADLKNETETIADWVGKKGIKYVGPILVARTVGKGMKRGKTVMALVGMPGGSEDKCAMLYGAGQQAYRPKEKIIAIFLIAESWMVKAPMPDDKSLADIRPSKHPDRQEVIFVQGMALDRRANRAFIPIDGRGKKKELKLGEASYQLSVDGVVEVQAPMLESFWRGYSEMMLQGG